MSPKPKNPAKKLPGINYGRPTHAPSKTRIFDFRLFDVDSLFSYNRITHRGCPATPPRYRPVTMPLHLTHLIDAAGLNPLSQPWGYESPLRAARRIMAGRTPYYHCGDFLRGHRGTLTYLTVETNGVALVALEHLTVDAQGQSLGVPHWRVTVHDLLGRELTGPRPDKADRALQDSLTLAGCPPGAMSPVRPAAKRMYKAACTVVDQHARQILVAALARYKVKCWRAERVARQQADAEARLAMFLATGQLPQLHR